MLMWILKGGLKDKTYVYENMEVWILFFWKKVAG